jgi:predicted nucleic acid-binding protein
VSELVLSGFVRVVTHRRIFDPPSTTPGAELRRGAPRRAELRDDRAPRPWIESGSEWITTDRDYSRFPGLRWRHPLAG